MPKFIASWETYYGVSHEIVDAETLDDARDYAFNKYIDEEWEDNLDGWSHATEYTKEKAEELGI